MADLFLKEVLLVQEEDDGGVDEPGNEPRTVKLDGRSRTVESRDKLGSKKSNSLFWWQVTRTSMAGLQFTVTALPMPTIRQKCFIQS